MLAYQDVDTDTCSNFRHAEGSKLPENEDRIFSRVALKAYGKSIECFGSLLDPLYVFRDAVNGHRNLFVERRILHRDISINNILQGKDTPGNRGVLIDFDRAMRIDRTSSLPSDAMELALSSRFWFSMAHQISELGRHHMTISTTLNPSFMFFSGYV